jgi:ribosomal protein S18 acetylase RimI-like enzyme
MVITRDYRPADLKRLYEIDHEAFSPEIAYSYVELQYYINSRRCRTIVAEEDGEVVGFVIGCLEPPDLGHIITIDVIPHHQRQKIGSRLLAEIEAWLWGKGASAIYLETPVDDSGARGFYEKSGYFILETLQGYYNDRLDAFVMMKTSR